MSEELEGVSGWGGCEGGSRDVGRERSLADDGKRILCDGRSWLVCDSENRREVWREEGARLRLIGGLADDGKRSEDAFRLERSGTLYDSRIGER